MIRVADYIANILAQHFDIMKLENKIVVDKK
jgi:hypothetical protein